MAVSPCAYKVIDWPASKREGGERGQLRIAGLVPLGGLRQFPANSKTAEVEITCKPVAGAIQSRNFNYEAPRVSFFTTMF